MVVRNHPKPMPEGYRSMSAALSGLAESPKIIISRSNARTEDFERVGSKLSEFTVSSAAPNYNPLSIIFKSVSEFNEVLGEAIVTQNWGKLEIDLMFVEEKHRRKGIGKGLMTAIEDFGKAEGLTAIRLNTPTWQGAGFYEKCGFSEMGRIPLEKDSHGNPHFEVTYFKLLHRG